MQNKLLYTMIYFPESDSYDRKKVKIELDLSNYAHKFDLKNVTGSIH